MPISSNTRKAGPYTGTGSVTTYPFSFKVFEAADLYVVQADTDGIETVLVLNTDYTVSLNADQDVSPGGNIVLASALASGYTLVATSSLENLQPTDLTNQGGFYPSVITDALDRACIQIQQLQESVDRSVKVPITSDLDPTNYLAEAHSAAAAAQTAQAGAELALDEFTDLYLGAKDSDPTADNDGNTLQEGAIYFNTPELVMKVYSITTGWLVAQSAVPITITTQLFSGTGSQTAFTLSDAPVFLAALEVVVGGVPQIPTLNYTLSGTTLTFTSAPPSGTNNIFCRWFSSMAAGVPNDGSVTEAKLSLSDNASYDVTTTRHGFAPKLPNDASKFLDGTGSYSTLPSASTTAAGISELADSTEAAGGTEPTKAITSATLRSALNAAGSAPVYACRAWVNFNGTGTIVKNGSGNVSSITDLAVGQYRVNFATAMSDINYCVDATGSTWSDNPQAYGMCEGISSSNIASGRSVNYVPVTCFSYAGLQDGVSCSVAVFR